MIQTGGMFCVIFPHETSLANKHVFHETYSKLRLGKHLSDIFPIQNGL
jgi:hypothetical protein